MRARHYLQNLKLDSWPVLIGGLVLSAVVSCMAATSPGTTTTTTTTTAWPLTMVARSAASPSTRTSTPAFPYAPYYTPRPFSAILSDTIPTPSLTPVASVSPRTRYLIWQNAGAYLSIGTPSTSAATTVGLTTNPSPVTYGTLLSEVLEAVPDTTNPSSFRLDSDLHALYSLDVGSDGTTLVFHNNWGTASLPTGRGYLLFEYNGTTKKLIVRGRYTYETSGNTAYTHTAVANYAKAGCEVSLSGSTWSLAAGGAGTELTLAVAPVSVGTPTDLDPDVTASVTNDRVPLKFTFAGVLHDYTTVSDGDLANTVTQNLAPAYAAQVAAAGDDAGTAAAASTELDQIALDLQNEGSSLRYPKAVYLAFRKAALGTVLKSDDIANGTLGMKAVPYAYFTDAPDASGVHHPFLVLASSSLTDKPNRLVDVRRPPGDGVTASEYTGQKVTRDATLGRYLIKIPLKDYGRVSSLTENTYRGSLQADYASGHSGYADTASVYNLASVSGLGVMVDGSPIYPVMNNTLVPSQQQAELTSLGNHVGQGMELHYHADGHVALNNDFQLYNMHDYTGQAHPPLIGFGLDGIALYGTYESLSPSMEGISDTLDAYGGHTHSTNGATYGYHYHAHQLAATTTHGTSYTIEALINGAWAGKINDIPEFWEKDGGGTYTGKPSYAASQGDSHSDARRYVGKTY